MLENYFEDGSIQTDERTQRLLAVQAALEIAKVSAAASSANVRTDKVEYDLKYAAQEISNLADAIQKALSAK
ncbi:hypothetical protein [Dickeya chrysanthemi]|uniref:hypothetical protein n=1 Tax=Dickeya chrysanthemi TaxID=556 RepID=UPI000489ED80|nr:hypothetical protein [Dickeya chrysanthemi]